MKSMANRKNQTNKNKKKLQINEIQPKSLKSIKAIANQRNQTKNHKDQRQINKIKTKSSQNHHKHLNKFITNS